MAGALAHPTPAGPRPRQNDRIPEHDGGPEPGVAEAQPDRQRRLRLSQTVWRIAADTARYPADDLSGGGAKATGGRWNAQDHAVLYTSTTRALACLETLVHLNAGGLPLNRYLVEVAIPDPVWTTAQWETPASLPVGWDAEPASLTSIQFGT